MNLNQQQLWRTRRSTRRAVTSRGSVLGDTGSVSPSFFFPSSLSPILRHTGCLARLPHPRHPTNVTSLPLQALDLYWRCLRQHLHVYLQGQGIVGTHRFPPCFIWAAWSRRGLWCKRPHTSRTVQCSHARTTWLPGTRGKSHVATLLWQ